MKVLVVAAHPDDEILGVGGTILRHVEEGDEVYVCLVTKAHQPNWSREYVKNKVREAKEVDKILGIKKRINCNFPTVKLNTIPTERFNSKISGIIERINPDIIYTHFEKDVNIDHGVISNSVLVGARPKKDKNITVMCFETLSSTEWGIEAFKPNFYVDISKYIDKKIEAFSVYKSEIKDYPHPRSPEGIRILARKRGSEICKDYAEAFVLIRGVK